MYFMDNIPQVEDGKAYNPYAAKTAEGEWLEGIISLEFLDANFGSLIASEHPPLTIEEFDALKDATTSEGLQLLFDYWRQQGLL